MYPDFMSLTKSVSNSLGLSLFVIGITLIIWSLECIRRQEPMPGSSQENQKCDADIQKMFTAGLAFVSISCIIMVFTVASRFVPAGVRFPKIGR